jgi:hypothetical protein
MLAKRATLALLAVRALSALASPVDLFTVQNSDLLAASDSTCSDTESANAPVPNPEVRLDDGLFVGVRKGVTDKFLGIAFALPP